MSDQIDRINLVVVLPVIDNPCLVADKVASLFQEAGLIFMREGCYNTARMFYNFTDELKNYQPPIERIFHNIKIQ